MTTTASRSSPLRAALGLMLPFLAAAVLQAQVAPATPAAPVARNETIERSPFIVSTERETGWSANDTLSATRTKQALKDVPVAIDAITADFMEDLGLFTADEVVM